MLGIVIDENQPEYERGDFLVRPIIGADAEAGTIALGRAGTGRPDRPHAHPRRRLRRRGPARGAARPGRGARLRRGRRAPAVHLQRPRLAHVRGARPRRRRRSRMPSGSRPAASSAPARSGRWGAATSSTASRRRWPCSRTSRAGGAAGGRGTVRRCRIANSCEISSPGRWPRTSAPVTSPREATVPADARANATIVQKQPGVVFGLDVAAEAFAQAGAEALEPARDRGRVARLGARRRRARQRPGPSAARRRAHGAQPALPPLGGRDADRPVRRRGRAEPARRSSTRARRPRGCGRWRRRRSRRAAGATTAWASTTRS